MATQFERPGAVPHRRFASEHASLRDEKDRNARPFGRDSSADVQRAVQGALEKRRAFIAASVRDGRVASVAGGAPDEPTMLVAPLATARETQRNYDGADARERHRSHERESRTALLYMLLAVLTCVLAPVAWIHAEEQLMRCNSLVFRVERVIGLALTLVAVAAIACGATVLLVRHV